MMGGLGFGCCGGFGALGGPGMILNVVITIGLIIGFIVLIVWLVRRVSSEGGRSVKSQDFTSSLDSPLDILKMRYAQGEITREDYQQMITDLN